MLKGIFKMIGIAIGSLVLLIILTGILFVNLSPEFGGGLTKENKATYSKSGHYVDGKFHNLVDTKMDMPPGKLLSTMVEFFKGNKDRQPDHDINVKKIDSLEIVKNITLPRLTWFGHSAFLLELEGNKILIDPMLGPVPAPHPLLGRRRYSRELPIAMGKIPQIDAVIISHDHYDHLDYGSIQKLKDKVKHFYVPLGVGAHLKAWGIGDERIHELNWWDEIKHGNLLLAFTPSRHFSGRGVTDRFNTLWGSWVIKGENHNIYFSGDGGYADHFMEIGEKYGPFDFAMMECGQYNVNWSEIHMMPEETAQAAVDVNTKLMMPIHWGAFTLAMHSWTDPVERVVKKANELGMPIATPRIGEPIIIGEDVYPKEKWWME